MKRTTLLFVCIFAFILSACGGDDDSDDGNTQYDDAGNTLRKCKLDAEKIFYEILPLEVDYLKVWGSKDSAEPLAWIEILEYQYEGADKTDYDGSFGIRKKLSELNIENSITLEISKPDACSDNIKTISFEY